MQRLERLRAAERVALRLVDAEVLEQLERHQVLDTLRDHPLAALVSLRGRVAGLAPPAAILRRVR